MHSWKRIIVAIDESVRSLNAVDYVGGIAGHFGDVSLCLLHIYPEPPPDYYRSGGTLNAYQEEQEKQAEAMLAQATEMLHRHGIPAKAIRSKCLMAYQKSISSAILELQEKEGYGTIVVGKRGISKAEEFLFGSISNALIHNGKDIAVWVIG